VSSVAGVGGASFLLVSDRGGRGFSINGSAPGLHIGENNKVSFILVSVDVYWKILIGEEPL